MQCSRALQCFSGSKYQIMRYNIVPQTILTIPNTEAIGTSCLGTLGPEG